jgi:hypothetical protein
MRTWTSTLIENSAILLAGGILMLGTTIALAIVFLYATAVVLVRRLSGLVAGPQTLT